MADRPLLIRIFFSLLNRLLPGNYLKTTFYLNAIARPRKAIRLWINGFFRINHIYDVLIEFKQLYKGNFSILEFGTGDGYAFTKMLYATKYLHMDDRIIVHTLDSNRVYRFIHCGSDIQYEPLSNRRLFQPLQRINDSPIP